MRVIQCSMCHRRAAWLIEREFFCEGQKERIVQTAGVGRFSIRRLTETDCAFRGGGRFSWPAKRKKEADESDGQTHSNAL